MKLLLPIYVIVGCGYPILLRIADGILRLHTTEVFSETSPYCQIWYVTTKLFLSDKDSEITKSAQLPDYLYTSCTTVVRYCKWTRTVKTYFVVMIVFGTVSNFIYIYTMTEVAWTDWPDFAGLDMPGVGAVPTTAWPRYAWMISARAGDEHASARPLSWYHTITWDWAPRQTRAGRWLTSALLTL